MADVGIIANPVSGKDIRRLVAYGSVFDNQEKVRIVRRLLIGLEAVGTRRVFYMPDSYAIVERARRGCAVSMDVVPVPMRLRDTQDDSTEAARWMASHDVGCLIVLGGDGTCRAAAKGSREIPMLALSTGTNNVFPSLMEATVGGIAAGLTASGRISLEKACTRSSCLEIVGDDGVLDLALVDVAAVRGGFVGSKALWDVEPISELFFSRCSPESIGLSAVGGQIMTIHPEDPLGLHLVLGPGGFQVTAPIAPGLVRRVSVNRCETMAPETPLPLGPGSHILALDGEREVELKDPSRISVRLSPHGPLVVCVSKVMGAAQDMGLFVERKRP
uniref:ATP-NAD kinase n=1 Tax=Desulfacinum infernum TaxID=35837 RepID=A0A832EJI0_9BACT